MAAPNTTNNVTVRKLADVAEGMWNKSKNAFVNASGDTMTGRLTMENVPINQIVTGTGVAATSSTSGGTTTYYPAKWNFDLGIATPSAGDQLVIKIPVAGHDNGTFMSTDNGTTYFPVAQSTGSIRFTTRYPVNAYVFIVFEEYTGSGNSGQVNDCYALTGSTGRSSYKVGCWRVVNDYDSGNTYDRLYTSEGRFRTGSTGCYPYSLVCLDNTQSYSTLVTSNPGTGTNKAVNTAGKFVFPASIRYYSGNNTTEAGALVSSTYATYLAFPTVDVRYSSNHTVTFTTHKPVYIECTLNGDGTWSPTSVHITQTLRTGYYYIYLGITYSKEYQLSLAPDHPMYYYDGTNLVSAEVARGEITAGTNNGELNVAGTDITVYTHPTDSGNKHIPAGGSSGQFLGWDSAGTAKWVNNPNTDIKVKATAKTDDANYKILATASASPTSGAATEAVYDTDITLNPSTNTISANVSGTAASAGKLTTARTTYVTLGTNSTSTTRDWSGTTTIPVSGTLGIGNGGTGATSAAGARTNLDVYSKSETESLLNGKVVIVTVLPATGEAGVTYYVKDTSATGVDKYDEYIWAVDAGATTESWIHVGEKSLDLSEYVNSLTTSGTGPLVKSLSKSGNTLTATLGTIAIDNLSDWASSTDVTVSSVTYHTWWPVAPTSSNQVYGLSIYNGRLYRVYNNKGTYSVQNYDANTTYTNKSLGQGYGTCATEAATAAKIVSMSEYALTTGGIVTVKFTNALCASATMNINGKGAKPIYIKGAAVTANNAATVSAGDTAYFMYDGTAYHLLGTDRAATNPIVNISRSGTTFTATRLDGSTFNFTQQDNNTTYTQAKLGQGYGTCTTAEATAAKSVTLTGYELEPNGVVAVKFTNGLCASATMSINGKTATPIYINGAAVTSTSCKEVLAGDLAFFIYDGSHYQFICTDRISKNGITGLSISGRTITYTRADGSTDTLTTQDTTYTFDGVYNSSSNKAATVSTVTNAVNALDVDDITGFGAGKTLATLTETDGKIAATFQNISITKSQVSDFSHAHGNITNGGALQTNDVTIASGDKLVITDASDSNKVARASAAFDGSTTSKALTQKGTFESFAKSAEITSAINDLNAEVTSSDGKNVQLKVTETHGTITNVNVITDNTANVANSVYYVPGTTNYPAYSASSTYEVDDEVVYSSTAYKCSTAITTAEEWTSSHWTKLPTAVWRGTIDGITAITTGLKIAYKIPINGGTTSTYLNINGYGNYYVYRNTGHTTTHLPVGTVVNLTFDGTSWKWADYYTNSTYAGMVTAYVNNAGDAAKTASSTNFKLTSGITIILTNNVANTKQAALTLNVNSTGAKPLYINGVVSSSSNYTIPVGTYFCHYDGTNWNLWTDGTFQATHFKGELIHNHGNIANGGTLTDTAAAAAGNDYVVIRDADSAKIQTSTIKGTDVADAVSKKHSHSTLTLSTTAQTYDGSHTLALPSTDPYTSARTPASHTHGNIANGGTLTDTAAAAAGNDYVVIRDADSAKIQTSTIKGTDVADAVSKKHSHSTLTLSTTAQTYDGSHTLALPSTDPYTSARTPASHSHGNIQNGGTLQTTDVAIANGDKLVITDSSDSNKVARASAAFDGSTTTKALTQKGTFETFTKVESSSANGKIKIDGTDTTVYTHPAHTAFTSKGSATKVPQITTDALGHVTSISEVTISGVTPASHTHGNIANGGTLTDTAAAAAGNDYVVIRDADNAKIQTSTIKGTDVADAVSKKHSHSTLTLSTTAQAYDGSHTLALPSTDPYTSARTPASHTHGNITNDGKVGTTADYAVVTTTGGAVTATSLATSSPTTSGNTLEFIDTVSQNSKGKISATKKKVTIDDTYSSTGTNPVSGKAIAAAIETLDVTEVGGDGKYIKKIKEDNGKITATVETMDTTPTASSTKAVTSGGIKTALDGKQNTLATQTAYTSKGTSTKVPQITTNTLGQVTGITEVEISGVSPAPHEHDKLSYTAWANASLPNNAESGVLRRFYCSLPNYNFCVKLFDVTQFYDGTIVDNGTENSSFVGDVSFHSIGGGTLVGKAKVVSGIAYNSTWVRLYGDNKFCHPIILKDSREIISTWISNSYIPIGDVGSTVSLTPTSNSNLAYCVIDCSTYNSMHINSYSVTGAPAWAFIDSTNKILTRSSGIAANSTVDVPQGAVKLICNVKNTTEYKTYCYVAIEAASPKYYLALHTEGVTMSCYMVCEGRFYTRMTATNTITARPLLTSNYILANLGASSPTIIPAGCSIQQNTIYKDVAGTLGTARKLAVSLSNTSTDTSFDGSADVTNIKTTGTLPVSNGGTGKTTVTAAEYNLLSKMGTDLSANDILDTYRFVFASTSPSESNGRLAGFRTATAVWSWAKDKIKTDSHCLDSDDAIDIWNSI